MILFIKDFDVLNLDQKLKNVVSWVWQNFGDGVITSAYRPGDPGVHGQQPVRGLDRRCKDGGTADLIVRQTNQRWAYDPARPEMMVCIAHGEGDNFHLHFQAHPSTRLRNVA